jgi:hypothetical protein
MPGISLCVPTRRLRKSINAGRLLPPKEMMIDPADRGRLNHIPFLDRLNAWWSQMKEHGWLKRATPEQKETLVREQLAPPWREAKDIADDDGKFTIGLRISVQNGATAKLKTEMLD